MSQPPDRSHYLQQQIVTAAQMTDIESRLFAAGMPVAALMEKVAGLISQRIQSLYAPSAQVGVLVGPGHNGGDGLVVARELHLQGYTVLIYHPFTNAKELTAHHAQYARSLGIPFIEDVKDLQACDLLIDALFGFGLTRSLQDPIATAIAQINQWSIPVFSIDLPSGIHTDTGAELGIAIQATRTFCLGLWKLAFLQDQALKFIGQAELIDFHIPLADIQAVLGASPILQRLTPERAIAALPLPRPPATYKYKQGYLLVVAGSQHYMGAALLTGLAARASGVGMLTMAVPDSLKTLITLQLPDALVMGCPETETGAIAHLPSDTDLGQYDVIACGPGLTPKAEGVVKHVLDSDTPLVLDADGLNILAALGTESTLKQRHAPTILTPHPGEFKRLFPDIAASTSLEDKPTVVRLAAQQGQAVVLLKGARVAIASSTSDTVWINPESTPALARGGSGDVLTGLIGGLLAQNLAGSYAHSIEHIVHTAVWWHAQAGILAANERTELGVDAFTLTQYLIPACVSF